MTGALRFQVHPALDDPVLVLAFGGWNDASEAASGTVSFINGTLKSVELAEIDPEEFYDFTVARPLVRLEGGEHRRVEWPSTEFRFGQVEGVDGVEIVTGLGTEPHMRWRHFSECVCDLAEGIGAQRVLLLGAYLADVVYSRPVEVTGFAKDVSTLERLGVERSGYEGPTGIVGVLSDCLQRDGREVLSLWACLPHYLNTSPNPRGSLALLEKIAQYLHIEFDTAELQREAEEFEERVNELVAGDPELAEYVRELKRRDFAQ